MVSGNFYATMEVQPALGRAIEERDDGVPGSGPVVVISNEFWTTRFGRSPGVIGKTIFLNGTPVTIVGVNPPGFTGASRRSSPRRCFCRSACSRWWRRSGQESLLDQH